MQTRGRILLADDEADLRDLVARVLERHGYEGVRVADGQQAVNAWLERPRGFDVLILDQFMPVMDGEEAFRLCRNHSPEARVLLVSGCIDKGLSSRLEDDPHARLVPKPFHTADLVSAIEDLLQTA